MDIGTGRILDGETESAIVGDRLHREEDERLQSKVPRFKNYIVKIKKIVQRQAYQAKSAPS